MPHYDFDQQPDLQGTVQLTPGDTFIYRTTAFRITKRLNVLTEGYTKPLCPLSQWWELARSNPFDLRLAEHQVLAVNQRRSLAAKAFWEERWYKQHQEIIARLLKNSQVLQYFIDKKLFFRGCHFEVISDSILILVVKDTYWCFTADGKSSWWSKSSQSKSNRNLRDQFIIFFWRSRRWRQRNDPYMRLGITPEKRKAILTAECILPTDPNRVILYRTRPNRYSIFLTRLNENFYIQASDDDAAMVRAFRLFWRHVIVGHKVTTSRRVSIGSVRDFEVSLGQQYP